MQAINEIIPQNFTGAVLVTQSGDTLFAGGFGYADQPNKIKNTVDTKFQTASGGKCFVAVGILQLIEAGQLSLEAQIGDVLDFDLHQIDSAVTIRQLLNHTCGIPDYFDESIMTEYADLWVDYPNYRVRQSRDLLPLFIKKPMLYPAGERFQYNNSGYVMLGLVIECVTGQPFDVYLAENVFRPSQMHDTGYFELDRLPAKCANAYIFDQATQTYYTNIFAVDAKGSGAGGAFTTVVDVEKFWQKLLSGVLLTQASIDKMFAVQSSDGEEYYGYGVWLKNASENEYHPFFQGSDPGVSFISSYDPDRDRRVHIVSNQGDDVWALAAKILAL